jgi:hypothetical protein
MMFRLFGVVLLSAASVLASSMPASAAEPVDRATIVFERDGRIYSMKSDGSGQRALTASGPDYGGAHDPELSPGGRHLGYLKYTRKGLGLFVAGPNGKSARPVISVRNDVRVGRRWRAPDLADFAWVGRRIYVLINNDLSAITRPTLGRVISMKADGTDRRVEFTRVYRNRQGKWLVRNRTMNQIAVSPDRQRMVIASFGDTFGPDPVELVSLRTGNSRLLLRDGRDPTWSPDGRRILLISERARTNYQCNDSELCFFDGKMFILRPDGTGVRRVIRPLRKGSESSPDWSRDGKHIVFASNRNYPDHRVDATEIYSVRANGRCLTWLTNGSPASHDPSWGPGRKLDFAAGKCGARREPLVTDEPDRDEYWLGPVFSGMAYGESFSPTKGYADCVYFRPGACGTQWSLYDSDVCDYFSVYDFDLTPIKGLALRRGALYTVPADPGENKDKVREYTIWTGGREIKVIYLQQGSKDLSAKVIDALRLRSQPVPEGNLPAPVIPDQLPPLAEEIADYYKQHGSIPQTAERFDLFPSGVRNYLRINRDLKKLGTVDTASCPVND